MPLNLSKNSEPILGYTLIERLGAGGFGEVWKAEAPGGLLKAIKFVYGEIADRHASQEVKALERVKQVRHPFVLSIERIEVVNKQLVIVSELADRTLLDRFDESRAENGHGIPRKELLRYMQDAAEALDFISANYRLQHLDIKPSNLFLVGGRLKVGDFGLVREVSNRSGNSTPGLSPAYASPESFMGDVSFYSDQYALAIVYQEMLTGIRPFRGRTSPQLMEQHLRGQPNLAPLPVPDQPVIARSLSKNPKDRFPASGEMVQALASLVVEETAEPLGTAPPTPAATLADLPGPFDGLRSFHTAPGAMSGLGLATLHTHAHEEPDLGANSGASQFTSSVLLEGLPRPTLFVGIGGIAGAVLRRSRHLFNTRLEDSTASRAFGWLLLDTDRQHLVEATQAGTPGHLRPEETLHMPLHPPEHYRPRLKQLLGWLGRHWVFRIPRSRCTEGIRPLGRLALIDNAEPVYARLRQCVRQVHAAARERGTDGLGIVLVASISGGTGGGCVIDVGLLLRRLLREERMEGTPVQALLVGGTCIRQEQRELARANAYVTLKELDHFCSARGGFAGEDALGLGATDGEASGLPFESVKLIDLDDIVGDEDVQTGARLLAEYVFLHRGTPYGLREADGPTPDSDGGRLRPPIRSFRLARFGFPRTELRRIVAREVCRRMVDTWLRGMRDADREAATSALLIVDPTITVLLPPSDEASRLYSGMELDPDKFFEVFLERVEHVSGTDAMKVCQHLIREVREARSRGALDRHLARFFEQCAIQFGPPPAKGSEPPAPSAFERKVQGEFKYDATDKLHRLEARIREMVELPGQRLKAADDVLAHFSARLSRDWDATPGLLQAIQDQKDEIRLRLLGDESKPRVGGLIRQFQRDAAPPAEELSRYVELCLREIAHRGRAELLRVLRAKVSALADELARLRQGLMSVQHLFESGEPCFRASERTALGLSLEVLPMEPVQLAEFRDALASSFATERRLSHLEGRFQDEVLGAHGGLRSVLAREPHFVAEIFEHALFQRVADAIGVWLEDRDAASLLKQRYGSNEGIADELVRCLRSPAFRYSEPAEGTLFVCTPNSPSGRSLRESLARMTTSPLGAAAFVPILEDVVLCLELDGLSLSATAADLVADQPWLAELAAKLVTRHDVAWADLAQTE